MKKIFIKKALSVFLAFLICGIPTCIYAAEKEETLVPKNKITEELYQEFDRLEAKGKDLSKEKIPVWVWYRDIDQKQVDREVEEQTGLTQENLAVDFEMPSLSLISSMKNKESNNQEQMDDYLARTAVARKLEVQRTDEYIMKRREISNNKYKKTSKNFLEMIEKKGNDIIYNSQYAPVIIMKVTEKDIVELSNNNEIELIDFYHKMSEESCSYESTKQTIKINKVYEKTGLTGKDVKVGMFEVGVPSKDDELDPLRVTAVGTNIEEDGHATGVAVCIAGTTKGIAPNSSIYATNPSYKNIEILLNQGVKVINVSWSKYYFGPTYYTSEEKWFDHIAAQHNILLVCSAGNREDDGDTRVTIPAMSCNTLAVGGYDDKETGLNYFDDRLRPYSSYDHTDLLKPDVVAPTHTYTGATSFAAPIVTGIAALLLELKPSLGFQPQVLKAILLASCQRKVLSHAGTADEKMEQGITRTQGAGAIDAWNAVCIVAQGNYGYGEVKSAAEKRNFVQPSYGASHMNVSIAWLRENTVPENNHTGMDSATAGTQHNLNLRVYRGGTLVGSSFNTNSSTEMAYIPLSASESRYQIKVDNYNHASTETARYGYAWSTDNMTFRENLTGTDNPEGIYYIRNQANANGAYLTVDEQTGRISQEAFTGEANQQWVSRKTGTDPFTIRTNSGAYPGYLSISGQTNAQIRQDAEQYVTFGGNGYDNTYGIQLYGLSSSMSRSLTALDGTAQSAGAVWQHIGIPERFIWYFEPVGYKRGDVNRDGKIAAADALLAQKYVSKQVSFDAVQEFLGDMNNDGQVNLTDISLIQQAVA